MLRICSLIVLVGLAAVPAGAQDISGQMRFIDADTLMLGQVKVRLFGIDAPEMDQQCQRADGAKWACGRWAADQAKALHDGGSARCTALEKDRYGRTVARCFTGAGDIAEDLVRRGIATAFRKYSLDYLDAEKQASITSRGIWAGTLEDPSAYRASKQTAPQVAQGDCAIKGNISGSGQIYHLPGQKFYDDTRISASRGERWFCSEAEAIAAGWRRAKQ